jgi:hypothetical protein
MAIRIARSFNWVSAAWQGYPAADCNSNGTWRMPLNATKLACSIVATRKTIEVGYFSGQSFFEVQAGCHSKLTGEIFD